MSKVSRIEDIAGIRIKCFDIGSNKVMDRYSVLFVDIPWNDHGSKKVACLGMSDDPYAPYGFGQHCGATAGRHLGKRISFTELPEPCQSVIMSEVTAILAEVVRLTFSEDAS